jgi:DNA-binding transcriptional ArsR family regulator
VNPIALDHVDADFTDGQLAAAASLMRLVAEPLRLRLLCLLAEGEADVTTLTGRAGAARPAVSQQLARLRVGGLIAAQKTGRRMVYRLRGGHVRSLIREVMAHADHLVGGHPEHD